MHQMLIVIDFVEVNQVVHTILDQQQAIVYPIQHRVLEAVDKYLSWLDLQDNGRPWEVVEEQVDYWNYVRSMHPRLVSWESVRVRPLKKVKE
jgi:hypothetical protein